MNEKKIATILEVLAEKVNSQATDIWYYKHQLEEVEKKLARAEEEINKLAKIKERI